MLSLPVALASQDLGLDGRLSVARHGGGCVSDTRVTNLAAGLDVRTRGRWIASTSVDVFAAGECLIGVDGDTDSHFRFRAGLGVGYSEAILGVRTELLAGLGAIRTTVEDDVSAPETHWYPWQGVTLSLMPPQFPVSFQFELGRHRLPARMFPTAAPVIWQSFMRWGISFSILG
jgi:hypothetical protein